LRTDSPLPIAGPRDGAEQSDLLLALTRAVLDHGARFFVCSWLDPVPKTHPATLQKCLLLLCLNSCPLIFFFTIDVIHFVHLILGVWLGTQLFWCGWTNMLLQTCVLLPPAACAAIFQIPPDHHFSGFEEFGGSVPPKPFLPADANGSPACALKERTNRDTHPRTRLLYASSPSPQGSSVGRFLAVGTVMFSLCPLPRSPWGRGRGADEKVAPRPGGASTAPPRATRPVPPPVLLRGATSPPILRKCRLPPQTPDTITP